MESKDLQDYLVIVNGSADKIRVERCKVMYMGNISSNYIGSMVVFKSDSRSP